MRNALIGLLVLVGGCGNTVASVDNLQRAREICSRSDNPWHVASFDGAVNFWQAFRNANNSEFAALDRALAACDASCNCVLVSLIGETLCECFCYDSCGNDCNDCESAIIDAVYP